MAKWKELPPSPEAIVRAALERAAAETAPHPDHDKADWTEFAWECDRQAQRIRRLADYPAEVAAIIKKARSSSGAIGLTSSIRC
jgi:hypothetical protein